MHIASKVTLILGAIFLVIGGIGLVGGIAGALASIAYYAGMSNAFSTWAFHIPVIINTAVFLQIIGFVLVAALLTTPVGILRIGRMNLLEVVARHER